MIMKESMDIENYTISLLFHFILKLIRLYVMFFQDIDLMEISTIRLKIY